MAMFTKDNMVMDLQGSTQKEILEDLAKRLMKLAQLKMPPHWYFRLFGERSRINNRVWQWRCDSTFKGREQRHSNHHLWEKQTAN